MVPGKNGMAVLMLALKEAEIKAESIPVHMYQGKTGTKQLKYKDETPIVMVQTGNINETTTLSLPTEEEWRKATSDNHDIGYIQNILSGPEETLVDPKYLRNKGCVKPFQ